MNDHHNDFIHFFYVYTKLDFDELITHQPICWWMSSSTTLLKYIFSWRTCNISLIEIEYYITIELFLPKIVYIRLFSIKDLIEINIMINDDTTSELSLRKCHSNTSVTLDKKNNETISLKLHQQWITATILSNYRWIYIKGHD
jgi:hypothetical protein